MPPGELARLYDAHAPALFAFLLTRTRDEAGTRDLLQEVFLRLAQRADPEPIRDERSFLLRLAHNLIVDTARRREVRRRVQAEHFVEAACLFEATDPASTGDPEVTRRIEVALAGLPEEQRAVVQLKLWEGLTFEAIAEVLDIPPNTAASRYRYALEKLRGKLRALHLELRTP